MSAKKIENIKDFIKFKLICSRDCLQNQKRLDKYSSFSKFDINCPYYAEAVGILMGINVIYPQYYFGAINDNNEFNLNRWLDLLKTEVIKEEEKYGLGERYRFYNDKISEINRKNRLKYKHSS